MSSWLMRTTIAFACYPPVSVRHGTLFTGLPPCRRCRSPPSRLTCDSSSSPALSTTCTSWWRSS
eukprot:2919380-Pyramimonas_sp.AAC.1